MLNVKRQTLQGLLWILTPVILCACDMLKPLPHQADNVYTLSPPAVNQFNGGNTQVVAKPITLLVNVPKTHPTYQNHGMIYRQHAYQVEAYSRHRWVSSPVKMLQPLIVQRLSSMPQFHAVVASPFAGRSDYRLDTEIIDFSQVTDKAPGYFQVTIAAQIVDAKTSRVISSRRFSYQQPTTSLDPRAGVIAANQAMARILEDLAVFSGHLGAAPKQA